MTEKPTFTGRLVALVVGIVLFAAAAEVTLRFLMPQWPEFYSGRFIEAVHSEKYGSYTLGRPGFDGWFAQNNGDFRARIHINEFGLRNDKPISSADGAVWVVGDSMTFGWGVEEDERYSTAVGKELSHPTYNVASPGTNVCGYRALIERMPTSVKPAAVVVGLVLENDLLAYDCDARAKIVRPEERPSLMNAKIWLTYHSALYNILAVNLKKIDIVRQALMAIGLINQEQAYKRFFEPDEIGDVASKTAGVLASLCHTLPPDTPCAVLVIPARFEIANDDTIYRAARVALDKALVDQGIDIIDPIDAFRAAGFEPTHFIHDGHWSPLGHQLAASAVVAWWRKRVDQ